METDTVQCELCKHICKNAEALTTHNRDHHDGAAGRITPLDCPRTNCNSHFKTRSGFRKHLKVHATKDIHQLGYSLADQTLPWGELVMVGPVREVELVNVDEEEPYDMCPFCGQELSSLDSLAHHLVRHLQQRAEAWIRMDHHIAEEMEITEMVELIPGIRYGGCGEYDAMATLPQHQGYNEHQKEYQSEHQSKHQSEHQYELQSEHQNCYPTHHSSWNTRAMRDFEAAVAELSEEVDKADQQTTLASVKENLTRVTGSANTAEFILSFLEPVVSTDEEVLLRIKRPGEEFCITAVHY
ncbi:hypothetical protein BGZ52_003222 [Haplosporangium bisporale]|nr:hypothetical protein BGZ52_003222 [Haplosporangium bisporale]KAF9207881.1 hypothetical protein BGZ59_010914 [Podila verticillata]KFH64678.1 hypothetical protein MVEG_09410 [Podila verticillata NRRL 6337]